MRNFARCIECIPVRLTLFPSAMSPLCISDESVRKFRRTNWDRITPIYIYSWLQRDNLISPRLAMPKLLRAVARVLGVRMSNSIPVILSQETTLARRDATKLTPEKQLRVDWLFMGSRGLSPRISLASRRSFIVIVSFYWA